MTDTIALPQPITLDRADELAVAVIAEFGADHVYQPDEELACHYVNDDGGPDCIVAQILHRHGVPVEVLRKWENLNAADMGPQGVITTGSRFAPTDPLIGGSALHFLSVLQRAQDDQQPWGQALDAARRCIADCKGKCTPACGMR